MGLDYRYLLFFDRDSELDVLRHLADISAGRPDEAGALRDRLRQRAPQSYWTHYLDALLHYRAGRNDAAHAAAQLDGCGEKRMEALLQKQPSSLPALRLLAQAQLRQQRIEPAAQTLQRALALALADAELLALLRAIAPAHARRCNRPPHGPRTARLARAWSSWRCNCVSSTGRTATPPSWSSVRRRMPLRDWRWAQCCRHRATTRRRAPPRWRCWTTRRPNPAL